MTPANIIWKQLSIHTKMACGMREARAATDSKLICKVGGKPMRYLEVELDASDTYTVRYFRVKRNDYSQITLEEHTGVYVDALNEVCYHAVNK